MLTRKIGKLLRGKSTPFQVYAACILGSMIAFDLGSKRKATAFLNRVRLCALGESLGGVETLISHPETMTHASVPAATRKALGITPGLVRISVGIEDVEDLIEDLETAFDAI